MAAALAGGIDNKKTTASPPPKKKITTQQTTTKQTTKTVRQITTQSGQGNAGPYSGAGGYKPSPRDQAKDLPGGGKEYYNPQTGRTVATNARGEVQRIEAPSGSSQNKIVISRGARGARVVVTGRPGAQVVSYGPNRGFVEHPFRQGYISRTYVIGGRLDPHPAVYRQYTYRNVVYYRYVPRVYYAPGFYAWAGTGWGRPVPYAWFGPGLAPTPGISYYAGYFTPYPDYSSPNMWLTDYLLAQNLQLAYENQQAINPGTAPPPLGSVQSPVTPETKAMISNDVQQEVAQESAASVQHSLSDNQTSPAIEAPPTAFTQKIFVVSSNLEITAGNQTCSLTPGDIIERHAKDVAPDGTVAIEVVNSKPGDCAVDTDSALDINKLQEMHNQFQEQLASGLSQLANNQAAGLPAPQSAGARTAAEGTADPAPNAASVVKAQEDAAAQVETQVSQAGGGN
jgi:hypothetical protein